MRERGHIRITRGLLVGVVLLFLPAMGLGQTFNDLWTGAASFDLEYTGVGANIGFIFPSMWWDGTTLRGYYITGYQAGGEDKYCVDRASSTNGLSWTNNGRVLDIGGAWTWVYQAEGAGMGHVIGRADGDGWSANTAQDASGFLVYGPYTTAIPGGPNCASFKLMIDVRSSSTEVVCRVDVYDATSATVLAYKDIRRKDFTANYTYQIFNVNFTATAGHQLEFRTQWYDKAYIKEDLIAISQGNSPFWDGRIASFPGIWKDGSTWYLVYEGAGSSSWPGDIGLATSTDGITFTKSANNPILQHNTSGWESANIGTPSLYKENGVWYLLYHGFNGTDCQIGVASGTSLTSLTKYSGNPILPTSSSGWDSGTTGRRSQIFKEGSYYYFAYEGSTDKPFDTAHWSTGLARSTSILSAWSKCPYNPVVPQTSSGFGNDGPEMAIIGSGKYLYVRSGGASDRYVLQAPSVLATYEGSSGFYHQCGALTGTSDWRVTVANNNCYMAYGPYTSSLPSGGMIARWWLRVDNNTYDNANICTIDVYDATAAQVLATRTIRRTEWNAANTYQAFDLNFTGPGAGHQLEFRTYYIWYAQLDLDKVEIID